MPATETVAPSGLQVRASPTLFSHFVLGVTPHTTQAAFLECRAPVKVAACGRRWGKSTAAALDVLHLAVVGDAEGRATTQMVVAPTADQMTIIAHQVERLLLNGPLSGMVLSFHPLLETIVVDDNSLEPQFYQEQLCRPSALCAAIARGR